MKPWSGTPEFNSFQNDFLVRSLTIKQGQVWSRDRAPLISIKFNHFQLRSFTEKQCQVRGRDRAPPSSNLFWNHFQLPSFSVKQGQVWSRDRAPLSSIKFKILFTTIVYSYAGSGMNRWSLIREFYSIPNHFQLRSLTFKQGQVWSRNRAPLSSIQIQIIFNYMIVNS